MTYITPECQRLQISYKIPYKVQRSGSPRNQAQWQPLQTMSSWTAKATSRPTQASTVPPLPTPLTHPKSNTFAGSSPVLASLKEKADSFDPAEYWSTHHLRNSTIAATASTKAKDPPAPSPKPTKLHNPYADIINGRQLNETVSTFLSRLPPSTTTTSSIASAWIFIANPSAPNRATSEDWAGFTAKGTELLENLTSARKEIEAANPGKTKGVITRKVTPLRIKCEEEILAAAKERGCTTGKWMLFPSADDVDFVWGKVAKGTAEGELGVAAKVAAKDDTGEGREARRLICAYTKDWGDEGDVRRVLGGLKERGLLRGEDGGEGRGIWYKCGECELPFKEGLLG